MRILRYIAVIPVFLYQKILSPFLPSSCNYYPTCSEYTRRAILKHGVTKGTAMGVMRIGRCSARFYGGNDPVPEDFDWSRLRWEYRERSVRRARRTGRARGEHDSDGYPPDQA